MGTEQTRKMWSRHGCAAPMFGVKIGDMKTIVKKVKANHPLALELFATGNADAQYLAGLIAEPKKITDEELDQWVESATWYMVSEYAVAWNAAESGRGFDIGKRWIDSHVPHIASAGWSTLSGVVALTPDDQLKLKEIEKLLARVVKDIKKVPDRVKYSMNNFVISVGGYVAPLTDLALAAAERLGKVEVDMGDTECKVPDAGASIQKIKSMGRVGQKRKTVKC
jgi:3-methyladenine DNA glycosylase AlkD